MKTFFVVLLLCSISQYSFAAEKCSSQQLLEKTCNFFEKNAHEPFIKTSDGKQYPNPLFKNNGPNYQGGYTVGHNHNDGHDHSRTTYVAENEKGFDINELQLEAMNDALESQIELENIVMSSNVKNLPPKSIKAILFPDILKLIAAEKNPSLAAGLNQQYLMVPSPLDSPNGKMTRLNKDLFDQIKKALGEEKIQKIAEAQTAYATKTQNKMQQAGIKMQQAYKDEANKMNKAYENQEKRMKDLSIYAKDQIRILIMNGKKKEDLSEAQNNMIQKLDALEYIPASDPKMGASCQQYMDNAFYRADIHKITICPGLYSQPDSQIVAAIGHELGHAIDTCRAEMSLTKINRTKLDELAEEIYQIGENEESDIPDLVRASVPHIRRDEGTYINLIDEKSWEDDEVLSYLIKRGVIEKVAAGVDSDKNMFEQVRSCLVKEENIDIVTEEDVDASLTVIKSVNKRAGIKTTDKDLKEIKDYISKNKTCNGTILKSSEENESMSDFFGSYVQSRYLMENPPKTENDLYGGFSFFSAQACDKNAKAQMIADPLATLKSSHPLRKNRMESVYLKMPGIAKHFGCELQPKSKCFTQQEFLLSPKTSSQKSGSQK